MDFKKINVLSHLKKEKKRILDENIAMSKRFINDFRYHDSLKLQDYSIRSRINFPLNRAKTLKLTAFVAIKLSHSPLLTKNGTFMLPHGQFVRPSKMWAKFDDVEDITITSEVSASGEPILLLPKKWLSICKHEDFSGSIRMDRVMGFLSDKTDISKCCDEYKNLDFLIENIEKHFENCSLFALISKRILTLETAIISEFESDFYSDAFCEENLQHKTLTLKNMTKVDENTESIEPFAKLIKTDDPYSTLIALIRQKVKEKEPHFDIDEETISIDFFDGQIQFELSEHPYGGCRDKTWGSITADEFLNGQEY